MAMLSPEKTLQWRRRRLNSPFLVLEDYGARPKAGLLAVRIA
jgi:hypothetical protein